MLHHSVDREKRILGLLLQKPPLRGRHLCELLRGDLVKFVPVRETDRIDIDAVEGYRPDISNTIPADPAADDDEALEDGAAEIGEGYSVDTLVSGQQPDS